MEKFVESVLSVEHAADIDTILDQVEREYASYPADVKFIATQLLPLRLFKGFTYRFRPLVEKYRADHSASLFSLRETASFLNVFFPTNQWKAGFDYVTTPAANSTQWTRVADYQAFVVAELVPAAEKFLARMEEIQNTERIVVDNKILYGTASFQDNIDRYKVIMKDDIVAMIATTHGAIASMTAGAAYNFDAAPELLQELGKVVGLDGWFFESVEGFTSSERTRVVKQQKYNALFTLLPNGRSLMLKSFSHAKASIERARQAWSGIKNRPSNEASPLNSASFKPWSRMTELDLKNIEAIMAGPAALRSAVTGETIQVNLPEFFTNPPTDLKVFLPTQFNNDSRELTANGKKYNNPYWGMATGWQLDAFKPYLPSVNSTADLWRASQILSQTWGAAPINGPLAFILL
jgi:hypothetical protein